MASGCSALVCRYWRIIGVTAEASGAASDASAVLGRQGAERRLACGPGMSSAEDATGLPYHVRPTPHFTTYAERLPLDRERRGRPRASGHQRRPVIYRVLRKSRMAC